MSFDATNFSYEKTGLDHSDHSKGNQTVEYFKNLFFDL